MSERDKQRKKSYFKAPNNGLKLQTMWDVREKSGQMWSSLDLFSICENTGKKSHNFKTSSCAGHEVGKKGRFPCERCRTKLTPRA